MKTISLFSEKNAKGKNMSAIRKKIDATWSKL